MPGGKPNVVIILSDDVGWYDVGCYHQGVMGARIPNVDRIAAEGVRLTDCYAQASCTAGRAALITGQLPMRTGLTTVGMAGAPQGLQPEDPTLAELLQPLGYATAQIGKNHLGDRNEFLPTVHGFDEFYGNLYHLNVEEEPEQVDYPRDHPAMAYFEPRGVLDCTATDVDDPSEDPRFGRVGNQVIEDTGPLTRKRMETIEDDLLARSLDFIDRSHAADVTVAERPLDPASYPGANLQLLVPGSAVFGPRLERLRPRDRGHLAVLSHIVAPCDPVHSWCGTPSLTGGGT
jgi:arylsulfatase A-like enzyme